MSDSDTFELVRTLCELPAPVGHEDAVQDRLADRWGDFVEVRRTRVDNVLAKIGGSGQRLIVTRHADEICYLVKSIADDGFQHITPFYGDARGHPPRWMIPLSQPAPVVTSTGAVEGVFATASGHVGGRGSDKPNYEWNDWFVDIGVSTRAKAEALGVFPGARVIWNPEVRRLRGSRVTGKAMDDRSALAIATMAGEALARRTGLTYEVWLGSTVQEENGLLGAASLADELDLDLCLNLDVGLVGDIPGPDKRDFPCVLGGGPILVYADNTAHYSRKLTDRLGELAAGLGMPIQRAVSKTMAATTTPSSGAVSRSP